MRFVAICAMVFLMGFFAIPSISNWLDDPPDTIQHRCSANTDRTRHDPLEDPRPTQKIKMIKLTNDGEFVNRCELTDALYDLNWDSLPETLRPPISLTARKLPKLVVLYIHGWKHNGDIADQDLIKFEQLIKHLKSNFDGQKNVVGIYIAWNAEAGLGPLDNMTFWSKKTISDRIAQSAVVTKIIASVGAMMHRDGENPDQFIAIGHSFGARILFSATSQSLITNAEIAHPGQFNGTYRTISGSADAVVLLNPAFEAAMYTALDDFRRSEENFNAKQLPLIVAVATQNDSATQTAFPIGQWLGSARTAREMTTLGNYEPYITHYLLPSNKERCSNPDSTGDIFRDGLCLSPVATSASEGVEGIRHVQQHNPFLIVRTTKEIIDGHNGIWGDNFSRWLFDSILNFINKKDIQKETKIQ